MRDATRTEGSPSRGCVTNGTERLRGRRHTQWDEGSVGVRRRSGWDGVLGRGWEIVC